MLQLMRTASKLTFGSCHWSNLYCPLGFPCGFQSLTCQVPVGLTLLFCIVYIVCIPISISYLFSQNCGQQHCLCHCIEFIFHTVKFIFKMDSGLCLLLCENQKLGWHVLSDSAHLLQKLQLLGCVYGSHRHIQMCILLYSFLGSVSNFLWVSGLLFFPLPSLTSLLVVQTFSLICLGY